MKTEKNYAAAESSFVQIMKADAPVAMQRTVLLELALTMQESLQLARAQQIYAQYLERFPDEPSVAEIYLRQGLLYRQMGAPTMALSKFYAVMTTAMRLKLDRLDYYQRLVLQAQTRSLTPITSKASSRKPQNFWAGCSSWKIRNSTNRRSSTKDPLALLFEPAHGCGRSGGSLHRPIPPKPRRSRKCASCSPTH